MSQRLAQKVLLVGWDAADWAIIRPLVDRGLMPNTRRFIAEGVSGNLASLRPMLSPMLWTSIATGKRPHKHGIHGFTEPRPEGDGIRAVASTSRTAKAVWNILTQKGLKAHCVNWYASHPAEPINGVCVSNRFAVVAPGPGRPWPVPEGSVHPPELRDVLAPLRLRPEEVDGSMLLPFVPKAARVDQDRDKRLLAIAVLLAETSNTHAAFTWCLEHRPWDFAAVLYNGIDQFCHLFGEYHRLPGNPPPPGSVSPSAVPPASPEGVEPSEDVELYQGVVTAAYRFHDMMLGRLVQLAGEDATVIIVSDHGYRAPVADEAQRRPPQRRDGPRTLEALSREHRPQGVCLMRGSRVRRGETIEGASLLDVTPTVLTLLGLPGGADMDGRPWVEALDVAVSPDPIISWEQVPGEAGLHPPEMRAETPAESLEAVRHLIELGYVEPPDEDAQATVERTLEENRFNLARSLLDARRPTQAIELLEGLVRDRPGHPGYNAALFEAYYAVGRHADGRRVAEVMWGRGYRGPLVRLALGAADIAERKAESALRHLEEAERVNPNLPGLYALIGRAYLRLQQWNQAERAFGKALRLEGDDSESAWHGLACAALGRGEYELAAERSLRAVGLRANYPEAHYHLGVALARLGRAAEAETALRRCLSIQPNLVAAYGRLTELYEGPLLDPARARQCRQQANELILQRRLRRRREAPPSEQ